MSDEFSPHMEEHTRPPGWGSSTDETFLSATRARSNVLNDTQVVGLHARDDVTGRHTSEPRTGSSADA